MDIEKKKRNINMLLNNSTSRFSRHKKQQIVTNKRIILKKGVDNVTNCC